MVENVAKVVGRSMLHESKLQDKRVLGVFSSWGGICACFVERDRILNGVNSLIGEIGHMVLDPDSDITCGCGGHGCFERLVSNEQLRKYVAESIASYPDSLLNSFSIDELNVSTVFSASTLGDAFAQKISTRLARFFAMALRNVALSFDPEVVVFQGDFSAADELFRETIYQDLGSFLYYPSRNPFNLYFDQRPIQELNIRGSYTMLLDHLFSNSALYE